MIFSSPSDSNDRQLPDNNSNSTTQPNIGHFNQDFLHELTLQHSLTLDNKKNIEGKANNIITIAGASATLLFGFAAFLADTSKIEEVYLLSILVLLSVATSACVISIILSVVASRIQKYRFPIDHSNFYESKGELKTNVFWEQFYKEKIQFHEGMAIGHLTCIKQNTETNERKARYVVYAQSIFFFGILIIPILLILLILGLK